MPSPAHLHAASPVANPCTFPLCLSQEVEASIAAVQKESDALLKSLDAKVDGITSEVLARVLPAGVKI